MKLIFELVVQDNKAAVQLDLLKGNLREINKELKLVDQDSKAFQSLVEEAATTRTEIKKLTDQQKELRKEFQAATVPTDSLAGLRIEYSKLVEQITKLTKAERESDAGKKLIANAGAVKNEINEIQESVGNFTGSVGNYKGGILAASEALGIFGGTLSNQTQLLQTAVSVLETGGAAAKKFYDITKAGGQAFRDNVAQFREYLSGLRDSKKASDEAAKSQGDVADAVEEVADGGEAAGKGLAESAKGAGLLSRAGGALGGVLKGLGIGLIITLVTSLIGVFTRFAPVIDFVEQVVDGLSAAFDVLVSRAAKLVTAFGKFFSGDFSGAFDDVGDAVSGLGAQMVEAAAAAAALRKEMQDLEDAQKDFELTTARNEAAVAKLTVALKDRTKSDSDRLKLAAQITKIETNNLNEKTALIDKEIDIERRRLLLTGQVTKEQADQIAAGNFVLARQLEDEFKLQADQTDRIRELLIKRTQAEGESAVLLERIDNRRNAILEDRQARQERAAQKAAASAEKEAKALEAQIARIRDLEKSIRDLDASTITNDFERQAVEIENKRAEALAKVGEARDVLTKKIAEQKGVLTEADKKELALISEQTGSIIAAYDLQQDALSEARDRAVEKQKAELAALTLDIAQLAEENAQRLAEAESEIANADFAQQRNELLAVLNERKKALTEQLIDGSISQKKFKEEYLREQEAFNVGNLELERKRASEIKRINDELESARIEAAKAALAVRLAAIEAETETEIQAAKDRAKSEGGDAGAAIDAIKLKAIEKRTTAELDFDKTVRDATEANKQAQLAAIKDVDAANEKTHQDQIARIEDEKERRKRLRDAIIEATQTIAGAAFEIERNRIDQQATAQTAALDKEFEQRRELAQGNTAELEALDKEYQKRKEAIEKEAAQKRKRLAVTEAIIQGALAVVKSLPNLLLAAVTAVATAAQVAVINSQTFAQGGIAQFRKAGMFKGRSHAQGGVNGYFSDGTRVNVEKDEVFVILNKRASRELAGLSEHNYRHGGRRFDAGGSLDFTPQFPIPNESGQGQIVIIARAEVSDESVEKMAREIADKTSTKTQNAVVAGLDERNRTAERELLMEESRQV